jgi:hypothetical protein
MVVADSEAVSRDPPERTADNYEKRNSGRIFGAPVEIRTRYLPNANQMRRRLNEVVRFRTTWTLRVITTQIDAFQIIGKTQENDQHIREIITGQVRGEYAGLTNTYRAVGYDKDDVLRHRK